MTNTKTPTAEVAVLMAQLVYFTNVRRELDKMEHANPFLRDFSPKRSSNWTLIQKTYDATYDNMNAAHKKLCDLGEGVRCIQYDFAYGDWLAEEVNHFI